MTKKKTEQEERFTNSELMQLARETNWAGSNLGPRRVRISSACNYRGHIDLGSPSGKIRIELSTGDMAWGESPCELEVSLERGGLDLTLDERAMTGGELHDCGHV